jgi:hypothetical protein
MRRLRTQARVNLLLQVVAASLLGSVLSMMVAALLTFGLPHRWLNRMVSFSAGVLLATALLDLLPEALEGRLAAHSMLSYLLAGLVSFLLEKPSCRWVFDFCIERDHESVQVFVLLGPDVLPGRHPRIRARTRPARARCRNLDRGRGWQHLDAGS